MVNRRVPIASPRSSTRRPRAAPTPPPLRLGHGRRSGRVRGPGHCPRRGCRNDARGVLAPCAYGTCSRTLTQHHPDKAAHADTHERIRLINAAYETLRDPALHAAYEARRAAYLAQVDQARAPRIADSVDVDALDLEGEGDAMRLTYPCRCGQQYVVTPDEIARGQAYFACTGCSEVIRLVYDRED